LYREYWAFLRAPRRMRVMSSSTRARSMRRSTESTPHRSSRVVRDGRSVGWERQIRRCVRSRPPLELRACPERSKPASNSARGRDP
jgi:hypothetical protein